MVGLDFENKLIGGMKDIEEYVDLSMWMNYLGKLMKIGSLIYLNQSNLLISGKLLGGSRLAGKGMLLTLPILASYGFNHKMMLNHILPPNQLVNPSTGKGDRQGDGHAVDGIVKYSSDSEEPYSLGSTKHFGTARST